MPIEIKTTEEGSDDIQEVPPFEKENYELSFEYNFKATEIAIVKVCVILRSLLHYLHVVLLPVESGPTDRY